MRERSAARSAASRARRNGLIGVYLTFSGVYPLYHIYWGLSMGKEKAPPRGGAIVDAYDVCC
jgi:hypothetical protein